MGSVDVRERHDPFHHPRSLYQADENDFLKDIYTGPPGEFALEMTGLLYCKGCDAYPGTTIVLSQVDECPHCQDPVGRCQSDQDDGTTICEITMKEV